MMLIQKKAWIKDSKALLQLLSIIILIFIIIPYLQKKAQKPHPIIDLQKEVVNIAPEVFKAFSLGQHYAVASLMWVETMLRSDLKHHEEDNLKNWMYLRLKTITTLKPYFYESYLHGGIYLSIIKDDELGAKEIFDRGLNLFPNDYSLHFHAGFHYFSELNDTKNAISIFEKAITLADNHSFLPSLVAKLKSDLGDLKGAKLLLEQRIRFLPKNVDPNIKKRLLESLYAVKAELDLNCLNSSKSNCDTYDLYQKPYIKTHEGFRAQQNWKPFRRKN